MRRVTRPSLRPALIGAVAAAIVLVAAGAAMAQVPDEFQNLKVLPKDIDKRELINTMKGFALALGVRCQHCHVGEEGMPLDEFDFVSDQKPAKNVARVMLEMTREINQTFLPRTGREELLRVSCATCHHGQARPQTLEEVLAGAVAEDGVEAALARYRELRERYYGSSTYDFSERALTSLAERLVGEQKVSEAIAFLELNTELYPDSAMSYFYLGELHGRSGEKAKAIASFEKALELNPQNPVVRQKLERLKQGE